MDLERITQEPPLWFEDGNLVLTAADVSFKVHPSVLERHSEVFRHTFGLPQPDNTTKLEAAPAIHLRDDPRDLGFFLLAMYDGLYFESYRASNFVIISARLAYDPGGLGFEVAGWDLRERQAVSPEGTYESTSIRPHPIYVINLANELGAAGLHMVMLCPIRGRPPSGDVRQGSFAVFRGTILAEELEGRDAALLCEHVAYQNGLVCPKAFYDLALELYRSLAGVTFGRDSDPLFTLNAAMIMQRRAEDGRIGIHPSSRACEHCRAEFAKVAMTARQHVWDQLPCWFGLEAVLQGS